MRKKEKKQLFKSSNLLAPFLRAALASFIGLSLLTPLDGNAAEGASSTYFPGAYGSFAPGVAPDPGFTLVNFTLFYEAKVNQTVLQGQVNLNLDTYAVLDLVGGLYNFDKKVLGGTFAMGGFIPFGYANLKATIVGQMGPLFVNENVFHLGDIVMVPASLYWNKGKFHINLYEMVVAPTGKYDNNDAVNLGRNYWAFDTILAATYLDPIKGRDISVIAGIIASTRNKTTDYNTGTEFHLDFNFNQFFADNFAIGFKGYYYTQLSGDSGTGAILGPLKGSSVGVGPSLLWAPRAAKGKLTVILTWTHDLSATNRLKSDYVVITIAAPF